MDIKWKEQREEMVIKNPTPEGPDLVTPGRGYSALPTKGARESCPPTIFVN